MGMDPPAPDGLRARQRTHAVGQKPTSTSVRSRAATAVKARRVDFARRGRLC
jgi:hypothetical protein